MSLGYIRASGFSLQIPAKIAYGLGLSKATLNELNKDEARADIGSLGDHKNAWLFDWASKSSLFPREWRLNLTTFGLRLDFDWARAINQCDWTSRRISGFDWDTSWVRTRQLFACKAPNGPNRKSSRTIIINKTQATFQETKLTRTNHWYVNYYHSLDWDNLVLRPNWSLQWALARCWLPALACAASIIHPRKCSTFTVCIANKLAFDCTANNNKSAQPTNRKIHM